MLMNTSILYHPESISEMQLIITAVVWGLLNGNHTEIDARYEQLKSNMSLQEEIIP